MAWWFHVNPHLNSSLKVSVLPVLAKRSCVDMEDLDPFSLPSSSPPDNSSSSPLAHRSTCEAEGENPPIASPHGQLWGMDSSDPGVIFSSPVRNIADSRRKAQKARRKTLWRPGGVRFRSGTHDARLALVQLFRLRGTLSSNGPQEQPLGSFQRRPMV